ncbi:MAG: TIGR01777 family oxidoreductase [Sphingobacteriaceae bacterium]
MVATSILITGGRGLIGRHLTEMLLKRNFTVSHLSRTQGHNPDVNSFIWDIEKGEIDEHCIDGVDMIIHLAGAGIAQKPWSNNRKKALIESRTKSIQLIYSLLQKKKHQVKKVISASAIGFYGNRGSELLTEISAPGNDFLAKCCIAWEDAVDEGNALNLAILKFRTGVVLTDKGGALPSLAKPIKIGFGTVLGSGKQFTSWIHINDVLRMYLLGIDDASLLGVYNMVAPHPVTNSMLTKIVANHLHKPLLLPAVPAFALRIVLGEMCKVILNSTNVSADLIQSKGFRFQFTTIEGAIKDIYGENTSN